MSEIPEVFAEFERKFARLLACRSKHEMETKKAVEEILTYFSSVVERASKAEARIAELESELVTTKQKLTDCKARNAELEKSGDELAEELSDMESAKDDVFDEAWKLKAKVAEKEKQIEEARKTLFWVHDAQEARVRAMNILDGKMESEQ